MAERAWDTVRAFALALPAAEEDFPWVDESYRNVAPRLFVIELDARPPRRR